MGMTKEEAYKFLRQFEDQLEDELRGNKSEIIKETRSKTPPNGEAEGVFTKTAFAEVALRIYDDNIIIEGVNSKNKQLEERTLFGESLCPDFYVLKPVMVVGEIKYGDFKNHKLAQGIGQALMYRDICRKHSADFDYGCVIFFDTSMHLSSPSGREADFIKDLWDNESIYLIII